ncbi:hypothetical protein [Thermaurantimonas aggregans]|nr:hypothetical protein [Thermaurantimonas aggregans]MCX8148951.1 hypothetical protein [Thermaurantimonas aggregans]
MSSQTIYSLSGMRSLGLAGVSSVLVDGFSVINNSAGLAYLSQSSVAVSVQNRFGINDLNIFHLSGQYRLRGDQAIGLALASTGIEGFRENHVTAGYGLKLMNAFSIGVKLNLTNYHLAERGNLFRAHADLGAMYQVNNRLKLGLVFFNPFQITRLREYDEYFPTGVSFGASYLVGNGLGLYSEVSKTELSPMQFKIGIEWHWLEQLWLRTGYSHTNSAFSLGVGIHRKYLTANFSFVHMALPGGVSGADFGYSW